jgi:hypothetical protein
MSVLQIEIPSGYGANDQEMDDYGTKNRKQEENLENGRNPKTEKQKSTPAVFSARISNSLGFCHFFAVKDVKCTTSQPQRTSYMLTSLTA